MNTIKHFKPNRINESMLQQKRLKVVKVIFLMGFTAIVAYGSYLLTSKQSFLESEGQARALRSIELEAERGDIRDRNGILLAKSVPVVNFYINPKTVPSINPSVLQNLAQLLQVDTKDLEAKWSNTSKGFVYLARKVDIPTAREIKELHIKGLQVEADFKRVYPSANSSAQLLGFTGDNGQGQEGIELAYNEHLSGVDGRRTVLRDRSGNVIEEAAPATLPTKGQDLTLSIDDRLQSVAFKYLKETVEKHQADAGSLIMLDAETGEVLSMVNWPSFNPNLKQKPTSKKALRNKAIIDTFEPGSIMKSFPVAMAINEGKISPNTVFSTTPYPIGNAMVRDVHSATSLSVTGIIQKSSNVGTAKITFLFTPQQMWDFYHRIGIGEKPKLHFPGKAAGTLRKASTWRPIEQATMSFGYGLSTSLLHMAQAYTIFTNDGVFLPASLLKYHIPDALPRGQRIISSASAEKMRSMLISSTQPGGTATLAQIQGYSVAGKTGTTRKLINGRYAANRHNSLMVGFAPASNPKIITAIFIDDPKIGYYAGSVAAPLFSKVTGESLRILGVPSDSMNEPMRIPYNYLEDIQEDTQNQLVVDN
jgi:cell division protein FtsI (penicillin-binding protein 3)